MRDDITCGSHNCFQISGGRDMVIDGNRINGTTTAGVLTAGATRIAITRNRMKGMAGKPPCATQIASPGMEWDNYAGVENMISSAILIANNVIDGWGSAVQLDAARDVAIVHNTVADGTGVRFNHRMPHDQTGNVILERQQRHPDLERHPPVDLPRDRRDQARFRGEQRHLEGRGGGTGDVTSTPIFAGTAPTTGSRPAAPASTQRSELRDTARRLRKPPPRPEARHRRPRARRPGGGMPVTAQPVTRAAARTENLPTRCEDAAMPRRVWNGRNAPLPRSSGFDPSLLRACS